MDDRTRAAARRALDAVPLEAGFVRVVLDGVVHAPPLGVPATAWCDRPSAPRAFHVVHPYGMSLVWGDGVDTAFEDVVAHLRHGAARRRTEWLQIEPRWWGLDWDGALGAVAAADVDPADPPAVTRHARLAFAHDPAAAPAPAAPRADGWCVRDATAADFAMRGSVVPGGFWDDAAAFLAYGGGVVVERDGEVGAIAFASYRWDDRVEIGIETVEAHRRQGLARVAAAAMVERVRAAGLVPVWSCREGNVGSERLALAVGFARSTRGPYLHLAGTG